MRVAILGASGFIGQHLTAALRARGDEVAATSLRDPEAAAQVVAACDAVVNLAGAPVSVRWTAAAKRAMWTSRVDAPRAFLTALARLERRPAAYVSASAVGYYGTSTTATFTEESPPGEDFLARLCVAWEATADEAASARHARREGAHGSGAGRRWRRYSRNSRRSFAPVSAARSRAAGNGVPGSTSTTSSASICTRSTGPHGVLNATAPEPVTNRDFSRALGRALHRPAIVPVPAFAAARCWVRAP